MEIEIMKENLKSAIKDATSELNKENKWEEVFENRANKILKNKEIKEQLSKKFHKAKPFTYYERVSDIQKDATSLKVSVRYLGQEVAEITVKDDNVTISTKGYDDYNKEHFGCDIKLDNDNWKNANSAKEFRKHFRERLNQRNTTVKNNEEHRIESMLLTEFLKTKSEEKLLCGIQPVTFANFRFPMPTAIKASTKISLGANGGSKGGGIDILARTKGKKITVIELKDENTKDEPIEKVLEQATAYAVFLIKLLHSSSGEKWYKILGFEGDIPNKITIRVCAAMPIKQDGTYDKFDSFKIQYNKDILEYHWIYFKEENKEIKEIYSSM